MLAARRQRGSCGSESLPEFTFDLRHPNTKDLDSSATPLIERNPLLFRKGLVAILPCIVLFLLIGEHRIRH